jgi:DNA topoisomerase-1
MIADNASTAKAGKVKDEGVLIGLNPKDEKEIKLLKGRYGPYLKYDGNNFKLPKGIDYENISLAQALKIINPA